MNAYLKGGGNTQEESKTTFALVTCLAYNLIMREEWLPIKGYEGHYEISSLGRVMTLARIKNMGRCPQKKYRYLQKPMQQKLLKIISKSTGYTVVTLRKNGKAVQTLVHRLVAAHFLDNPLGKPQVNHKDGNRSNNNVTNLEWCTGSENSLHAFRVLGHTVWSKGKRGEGMSTSRPVLQKKADGTVVKRWGCGLDAVRDGGFESSAICRCCKGQVLTHKGFKWEYETP